jgi:hypothetical protein
MLGRTDGRVVIVSVFLCFEIQKQNVVDWFRIITVRKNLIQPKHKFKKLNETD